MAPRGLLGAPKAASTNQARLLVVSGRCSEEGGWRTLRGPGCGRQVAVAPHPPIPVPADLGVCGGPGASCLWMLRAPWSQPDLAVECPLSLARACPMRCMLATDWPPPQVSSWRRLKCGQSRPISRRWSSPHFRTWSVIGSLSLSLSLAAWSVLWEQCRVCLLCPPPWSSGVQILPGGEVWDGLWPSDALPL